MELVVNDKYVDAAPSPEALVALFEGQWTSQLPGHEAISGEVPLFADDRIRWALELAGGMAGKRVLELGPLEGGHSYLLEQAGAAQVDAIEANTLCYLRCLLVQQLYGLERTRFELGNFVPRLLDPATPQRYDAVVAAGVLYHLSEPVRVLDAICRSADQVYLWTHFLDFEVMPRTDRRYKRWFVDEEEQEVGGATYTLHRRRYKKSPTNEPKFIGGIHTTTAWVEKQTILDVFAAHGFTTQVAHETENRNGPSASFWAQKGWVGPLAHG